MSQILILIFVWILNFAISWWNARTVGMVWVETKQIGGWQRFMTWMGAIMSASGFTWCYLIVLLFGGYYLQPYFLKPDQSPYLTEQSLSVGFSLGYIIIVPGILFSGLMIWIDSLVQAWRKRDMASIGIAGWNTFAQIHNTYSAIRNMPDAWNSVFDFFKSSGKSKDSDSKGKLAVVVIILVIIAIASGILTTRAIIYRYAGSREILKK